MELPIQMNRVVSPSETAKKVNHAPQEGAFWPHNSSSMVKMADERLQVLPRTPSLTKLGVDETLQGCQFVCRKAGYLLLRIQVDTQNNHTSAICSDGVVDPERDKPKLLWTNFLYIGLAEQGLLW